MIPPDVSLLLEEKVQIVPYNESRLILVGPVQLPIDIDNKIYLFQLYCWLKVSEGDASSLINKAGNMGSVLEELAALNLAEFQHSSVLVYGDFQHSEDALVRMHSICHTGDIFGSMRCDCGFQLRTSMKMMISHGTGALFYLANQEGRGIGLISKAMAYLLQEQGIDTVDANLLLGYSDDSRDYTEACNILSYLRNKSITLITNNPEKVKALQESGLKITNRTPLWADRTLYNEKYINTKIKRSGHFLDGKGAREMRHI
ncbi:GTP cyclohydrolase II [Paenibacillus sp. GCM10012307]|uniref:GTP cyclohydrolase II n=1 Tax=Paenibacillus roseus TaxID=2798579 RepID=A0A934MQS1_9BACL|nr:GTP cyclohydrolase II [Paenibacillus roseus]